ncbi:MULTISPECIES: sigma-70 family RNA polymerase sigma factor [Streptomyces]|uniref:sigma-70 family RNA polymerase sigma factor n=1 Tax=Streptomyces TaxID=1883 RepID=UPI0010114321|nr:MULTISPECIES: sigma-70 family RNA polymerase sigma factor [unclassified Streptomyces]MDT0420607.1 sigma-70 family RNA polymerase sigma factor [Streptomyces sp. DSM 41859]NJA59838.1 sigma-70 family RNA polymerase sigma factor [Streptomyces sp. NEAU-H3]
MTTTPPYDRWHPLVRTAARAEALAHGLDPADLEQSLWVRLLERLRGAPPPADPAAWLRTAARAEARAAGTVRDEADSVREHARAAEPADPRPGPEQQHIDAELLHSVREAVGRLPGRCRVLVRALLSPRDPTYREIAAELGISQGSLGPRRSHCLNCLGRLLGPAAVQARSGPRSRPAGFARGTGWGILRETHR